MTKQEFLDKLRRALNGNMAAGTVEDNIRFYENYFRAQMEQGRSEADILNELGDPRILARTLIDAAERAGDAYAHEANETQYRTADGEAVWEEYGTASGARSGGHYGNGGRLPLWLIAILIILVLVVAISVIGSLIWMVLPYLIPVVLVIYIVRLFRRR